MQAQESNIRFNILVHQREDGKTVASVLEVPDCHVEADNREQAISTVTESLARKLETFEVISLELPTTKPTSSSLRQQEPTWAKSAGIFKNDPLFDEFQQEIQFYRNELDSLNSESVDR
jgi:predicted RNase H-like HicB family nuclease